MKTFLKTAAAAALAMSTLGTAQAAVIATLTYDTPTGTVASNESIPIWVTLLLDVGSDALKTDASGQITSGGPTDAQIMEQGLDPAAIIYSILNVGVSCNTNFLTMCGTGAYTLNFNYGAPSFIAPQNLDLQPGSVSHWLIGSFDPVGGNAPAGSYFLGSAGFGYQFSADNLTYKFSGLANTCNPEAPGCAFTRDVVAVNAAVPEPATWAMMILGFGLVGWAARRRRARVAFA